MKKFVFSLALRPALKEVFSDLNNDCESMVFAHPYEINNRILNFFFRVHMSKKINDWIDLPFKSVWKKYYCIDKVDWNQYNEPYLIIIDSALVWYSARYLNDLRKRAGVKIVLLLFNPMNILEANRTFMNVFNKVEFDLKLCTFDVRDAENYGCVQTYSVYSRLPIMVNKCNSDIVYLGMDKGRYQDIIECFNSFLQADFKADFSIINCQVHESVRCRGIKYISEISYIEYLTKVCESKAILEIVQKGQEGITLRTFEAIVYGKHLFTNNQHVKTIPFYNDRFIHFFNDIDEIDISCLKESPVADYNYNGIFSPVNLKKEIVENIYK